MCKFPVRYFVAIVTFVIGVFVASVWYQSQTSQNVQVTSADFPLESTPQIQENSYDEWETYFGTPLVWKFLLNDDDYGKIAVVRATGKTSNGNVRAILKLDCPGRDSATTVLVGDMESSGFNLDNYSVNSGSPVAKMNLVEIRAVSPKDEVSFKTKADGHIGYENLHPTVIFFELAKTKKLERLIAKGSTEVTFVIHDLEDYQRTITVTFPAIDSSSQMVKELKGCR